jgi:hypothetical protein
VLRSIFPIRLDLINRSGKLSTSTKLQRRRQKVSMRNLVSTSTDLSTSDQDSQWRELLNATEPTMFG